MNVATNAAPPGEDWRKKYFDSLRTLENEEQQFRVMEATLKRLAGRLCIASRGQSPRMDQEINKVQTAVRSNAGSSELDQLIVTLTDAMNALDGTTSPPVTPVNSPLSASPPATAGNDENVRAILAALLAELRRDAELAKRVDALDARLATSISAEQLPEVLSSVSEIVTLRIHRIEHARQEVETLLAQMLGKLDEISQFVVVQNHEQTESLTNSQTLNTHLAGEMQAMGESVESAADLQQIRTQVRTRLDTIGKHLQEFQQRVTTQASAVQARNEQMRARVAELEAKATHLHNQLKDEQRLSSLDALTKIPNRLAYEKRMAEELQRWQRFGQPTCIAAWDADHFKRINDTYGHRAGDRVLRALAECLSSKIRSTDFVARYGGEEFVMILAGVKLDDALRLIDAMRLAVAELKLNFRGTPFTVTMSCGVTTLQTDDSAGTAFDRADKALYQAKERGRNCCVSS